MRYSNNSKSIEVKQMNQLSNHSIKLNYWMHKQDMKDNKYSLAI